MGVDAPLGLFKMTYLVGAAVGGPVSPTRSGVANMENDGEQREDTDQITHVRGFGSCFGSRKCGLTSGVRGNTG